MDYRIDWGATNGTLWVCKPTSPCNDFHWVVPEKDDWVVKGGKSKGSKGGNYKSGSGDRGGKGAPHGHGRYD